jgi:hypothetical protein
VERILLLLIKYKRFMIPTITPQQYDLQGLLLQGYNYPNLKYIIFKINDLPGAKQFLAKLVPGATGAGPLVATSNKPWPNSAKPPYCLSIGFTYNGLCELIGPANCLTVSLGSPSLFTSYQAGAVADKKAMGDTDGSDPVNWWKDTGWIANPPPLADGSDLHIQITLFTLNPIDKEEYYHKLLSMIPASTSGKGPSVIPVFFKDSEPIVVNGDAGYIHFGYRDSLSQPKIDYPMPAKKNKMLAAGNPAVDDRPLVSSDRVVIKAASGTGDYYAHPLLVNGSFGAFRLLYQDVAKFEDYIKSDPELLAAKMCGRWRNGVPLVVSPDTEKMNLGEPGPRNFNFTNFNYLEPSANQQGDQSADIQGGKCPIGSHIRRSNPRDDNNVTVSAPNAEANRIVRRATPYGPVYKPGEQPTQRGLVGLFISAVLDNGFRFVTQSWFNMGGFNQVDNSPDFSGIDPLFGPQISNTTPNIDKFYYEDKGVYDTPATTMSRFIRTDGSMYLFLPGITGLQYISQGIIPTVN